MKATTLRANPPDPDNKQEGELPDTISGISTANNELVTRLQYLSDLLADAGKLPAKPLLVWREKDRSVKHFELQQELFVGRQPDKTGLAFLSDKLLSRAHFVIRAAGGAFVLEDLKSHNGTSVNDPEHLLEKRELRDGDIIFAGDHIFVFLGQRRPIDDEMQSMNK